MNRKDMEQKVAEMKEAGRQDAQAATAQTEPTAVAPEIAAEVATTTAPTDTTSATAETADAAAQSAVSIDANELAELRSKAAQVDNAQKMRREADRRNTEGAELRRTAEETLRRAELANQRAEWTQQQLGNAISAMGSMPPEMLQQFTAHLQRNNGGVDYSQQGGGAPPFQSQPQQRQVGNGAGDPGLVQQFAELKKNVEGFAFSANSGMAYGTIFDEMSRDPTLAKLVNLGVRDQQALADEALGLVIAKEREEPGSVNPHNPLALRKAAKEAVASIAARERKYRDAVVTDYVAERKAVNAKATASPQGPSAGVRAVPNARPQLARLKNESHTQWMNRQVREFKELGQRPVNGTRSDI